MNEWLRAHGMPPITVVEKMDRNGNRLTLETECLRSGTLPSIAYGFKRCSQKHKVGPQDKQPTKAIVSALLKDGRAHVAGLYSEKSGKTYDATVVLEDTGQYVNFKLDFDRQKGGGK